MKSKITSNYVDLTWNDPVDEIDVEGCDDMPDDNSSISFQRMMMILFYVIQ